MPKHSFIAIIDYEDTIPVMFITLRKGKQYRYQGFPISEFEKIENCKNVGSYIAINIIKKYPGQFVKVVPAATIEYHIHYTTTSYQNFLAK